MEITWEKETGASHLTVTQLSSLYQATRNLSFAEYWLKIARPVVFSLASLPTLDLYPSKE